jgi:hypothetical protein
LSRRDGVNTIGSEMVILFDEEFKIEMGSLKFGIKLGKNY